MCLIAIAWRHHPHIGLAVCANRDEFYQRPSARAHAWPDKPNIFAGRDLEQGGTWMGIGRNGRFAALTNIRDPGHQKSNARSRGELVTGFLNATDSTTLYARNLLDAASDYNGFNLLLCDGQQLVYVNNYQQQVELLEPGIHVLSNAFLNTPWPKTESARERLVGWLRSPSSPASLASLLDQRSPAPDHDLPHTGVSAELEKGLSPQFIELGHYGTRCSTGLLVDADGAAHFHETSFESGVASGQVNHSVTAFWPRAG
jgi:uncharacterized protein with NRDE domain